MSESLFDQIQESARVLRIEPYAADIASFMEGEGFTPEQLDAVNKVLRHLRENRDETAVSTLLKMSHLPLKEPKTFENFDFDQLHIRGNKHQNAIRSLPELAGMYAHKNIAFIGPQGVGKTHLAMAYGRKCCELGMKTTFLKATELNQRFINAIRMDREGAVISNLVKPSCLIIDEVGRCRFNRHCTEMFFDLIDRRYNKDGPNTIIFTSNTRADQWGDFFDEDSSLLCALDRIFDNATVFIMRGESYRGRRLETIAVEAGTSKTPSVPVNNR